MLLHEGSLHHAIEVYCEEAGVAFPEARMAVSELAERHGISLRRTRYMPYLLLALTCLLGSWLVFLAA